MTLADLMAFGKAGSTMAVVAHNLPKIAWHRFFQTLRSREMYICK